MPKLDPTHLPSRLQKRIAQLEAGEEVAAKDIRAVLNAQQQQQLEQAWQIQQQLRKQGSARTDAAKKAAGWKDKREVQIEVLKDALKASEAGLVEAFAQLQRQAEVRQGRIYFDTYGKAIDEGKSNQQAKNEANAALTRAGLRRLDGQSFSVGSLRDKQVKEGEAQLLAEFRKRMTPEELEQLQILEEHEERARKSWEKGKK